MAAITPFQIKVPDAAITNLKAKLSSATLPSEVSFSSEWSYGAPLSDVARLAKAWQTFDWRAQEARLNALPHFETSVPVDGFGDVHVHFVHQKSSSPHRIPLLFCHGWPGSFLEVTKMLSHLEPYFDVVAPSLPNFGFSAAVDKPGFALRQYAECLHKLMLRLGYDTYVTQGGDWGFFITRLIALHYPAHCLASHINLPMLQLRLPQLLTAGAGYLLGRYNEREKAGFKRSFWYFTQGSGYMLEQSTKPHTLGFGLEDSPVALLAWIYEKLHDWTDDYPWTDDEVLTWVSLYQFSRAGPAASVRIYYEAMKTRDDSFKGTHHVPTVPLGISHYPKDIFVVPKSWGAWMGPVVYQAIHSHGGHFAAWEQPEELAADLREMFADGAQHVAKTWRT